MVPDLKTHTLLRVGGPQTLPGDLPEWVVESLRRAPWMVVRRAPFQGGLIPVGVRGESRAERFAAWISPGAVLEAVAPQTLAHRRAWMTTDPARRAAVPALAALGDVEKIMAEHGLDGTWGPAGSIGFELASARVTATANSDLDLIIEGATIDACALWAALAALPVRVDVLLETLHGAVALQEYARSLGENSSFMLRTKDGPRLTRTLGHPLVLTDHDPRRSPDPEVR